MGGLIEGDIYMYKQRTRGNADVALGKDRRHEGPRADIADEHHTILSGPLSLQS